MCGEFMNDPPKLYLPSLYLRYSIAPGAKPEAKKEVKKESVQNAAPMHYEGLNIPQRPSIDAELAEKLTINHIMNAGNTVMENMSVRD